MPSLPVLLTASPNRRHFNRAVLIGHAQDMMKLCELRVISKGLRNANVCQPEVLQVRLITNRVTLWKPVYPPRAGVRHGRAGQPLQAPRWQQGPAAARGDPTPPQG